MDAPGTYFLLHLGLIRKIVFHMLVKTGYYEYNDMDELVQQVSLLLLEREIKITSGYQGRAKFSTYLGVVVTNLCREIRGKRLRERSVYASPQIRYGLEDLAPMMEKIRDFSPDAESRMIIREVITRLHVIFCTYLKKSGWILFCLKALWNIRVDPADLDLNTSASGKGRERILELIAQLNDREERRTKGMVYAILTEIGCLLANKEKSDDAIRKWLHDRIGDILLLLNGDPPVHGFTEETLQYLFDYYCAEKTANSPEIPPETILSNRTVTS